MKKTLFVVLISVLFAFDTPQPSECDPESHANNCIPKLATGFNFLKAYKVDGVSGAKEKVEYSYVFTTGTQYMINLCSGNTAPDGIVVSLYDGQRNKIATNKIEDQIVSAINFSCRSTGIYYIQYTFDGSSTRCGGSALGFKR
jgi:hypothetical protein